MAYTDHLRRAAVVITLKAGNRISVSDRTTAGAGVQDDLFAKPELRGRIARGRAFG